MRSIKYMALAAILSVGVFFALMYTSSCTKDACKGVTCLHKVICSGGSCVCPDGLGGSNCEIVYRDLYKYSYSGNAVVSYTFDTTTIDTGYVAHTDANNVLKFEAATDTAFSLMKLTWTDGANQMLSTTITLANNTPNGSTFKVDTTALGGTGTGFKVAGYGSVSSTTASLNLVAVSADSTMPEINITLSNCVKQ